MRFFTRVPKINFMGQRKLGLWVSGILTVAALVLVMVRGLNLGIDFTGGVLVEVEYQQAVELDSVRSNLSTAGYDRAVVQFFGSSTAVLIRLPPIGDATSAQVSTNLLQALHAEERGISLRRIEFVGPQLGEELAEKGGLALLTAFIGIMIYIAFRFEWKFSVGAVAALIHDAVMMLGFLSLLWIEFDITTMAAILALIGYSLNETIVIFDRVRENLVHQRRADILDVVNLSVNQTLMRSVITHLTTLLVLFALLWLGGPSVHSFSSAMIFGVLVSLYSSIYISTNLAVVMGLKREDLLPPEDKEEIDETP